MAMVWRTCPKCCQRTGVPNNQQLLCPTCGADMSGASNGSEVIGAFGSPIMWGGCLLILALVLVLVAGV